MTCPEDLRLRAAEAADAAAVAALHADSWRRHYRGAYCDAFLDGDVDGYLLAVWTERLSAPDPQSRTILAELGGEVAGLAHTQLGDDPTWGALLDNLHVSYGLKRMGVGSRLLALAARSVVDVSPGSGLYLWVLEQNAGARAFYAARGGSCVETVADPPPGDDPSRLIGRPMCLRIVWPDPSELAALS